MKILNFPLKLSLNVHSLKHDITCTLLGLQVTSNYFQITKQTAILSQELQIEVNQCSLHLWGYRESLIFQLFVIVLCSYFCLRAGFILILK